MSYASAPAPKPRSVLIIEDDEHDAFLLKRALNTVASQANIPLRIKRLANGLEALGAVARHDLKSDLFDVVIVDLNMPVMDGVKFLHLLREEFKFENLRAVVLTTSDEAPVRDAARQAGADDVFVKPSTLSELVDVVRAILGAD